MAAEGTRYKSAEETAEYYEFRLPYHRKLFRALARRLRLNKRSQVLDLCCGTGRLTAGIAPFVGQAVGIDNSEYMLSKVPEIANAQFIIHDISKAPFYSGQRFNHFLIGAAIQYIPKDTLCEMIEYSLDRQGAVILCHSWWYRSSSWLLSVNRLRQEYSDRSTRHGYVGDREGDTTLKECLMFMKDHIVLKSTFTFTPDWLINNQLSYSTSAKKMIADKANVSAKILRIVSPHINNGKLSAEMVSEAKIFSRIE